MRKMHFFSGIVLTFFVGLHLFNHAMSLFGPEAHIETMQTFRIIYRNPLVESALLLAVLVQIISGLRLYFRNRKKGLAFFKKLQLGSGLYLAFFLLVHVGVVLGGRYVLELDTNFCFGVAGLNTFPFLLFFVPYYSLAIFSFFAHIAAIHHQKMRGNLLGMTPKIQAQIILGFGLLLTLLILYGLTNGFEGYVIPSEYDVLIAE